MGTSSQRGYVTPRGKKWYGYFRKTVNDPTTGEQKVLRVTVIVGLRSQMNRSEAREALEREIAKQNGQTNVANRIRNDGSVSFGWFVRNRYLPLKESNWKEETAKVKKLLIQRDLIEPFDKVPLENLDKFTLQLHLNNLAQSRSRDRVLQIRAYLRDIFVEAVDQDFLTKDPARKVKVPSQLRETDKTTLTWEQLRQALSALSLRDRILLELDMTNALRPSELFALRWKGFDSVGSTMYVSETAYRGKIRPWGKTRKSLGVIHIPRMLAADLKCWREQCSDPSPEAFIFGNKDGDFMDTGNYRNRVLHKLAMDLKLPKLTFQVIRRTIATLAQKKGTVKDVQGVLRHSRAATTTDVYMQEIPKSVQATVDSINAELRKRPEPGPSGRRGMQKSRMTASKLGKR
jgi:integrase